MIQIVNYEPKYAAAFCNLNKEWIERYFEMEAQDYLSLENPDTYIIQPGGAIFIALLNNVAVGACALVKHDDGLYELSKMAVTPAVQGQKIGQKLADKIIQKARELHLKHIFLITNSTLKPAIALYQKLGFTHVIAFESVYKRGDVKIDRKSVV